MILDILCHAGSRLCDWVQTTKTAIGKIKHAIAAGFTYA